MLRHTKPRAWWLQLMHIHPEEIWLEVPGQVRSYSIRGLDSKLISFLRWYALNFPCLASLDWKIFPGLSYPSVIRQHFFIIKSHSCKHGSAKATRVNWWPDLGDCNNVPHPCSYHCHSSPLHETPCYQECFTRGLFYCIGNGTYYPMIESTSLNIVF